MERIGVIGSTDPEAVGQFLAAIGHGVVMKRWRLSKAERKTR
jgi:hypothetical protein